MEKLDKLIELLNEYVWKDSYWLDEDSISKEEYINRWDGCQCFINEHIISKRFGFIKWLIDNDKIEKEWWICPRKELVKEEIIEDRETQKPIWYKNKYTEYEQLLMYLAIQDEPIEFLCSILK